MKPVDWAGAAEQIGARRAERAGVVFLGAQAQPSAAVVHCWFGIATERLRVQVDCMDDPKRAFDHAGKTLDEWTSTLPVLQYLEPMAVGL